VAKKKIIKEKHVLKGRLILGLEKDGTPSKVYEVGDTISCTKEFASQLKKENKI